MVLGSVSSLGRVSSSDFLLSSSTFCLNCTFLSRNLSLTQFGWNLRQSGLTIDDLGASLLHGISLNYGPGIPAIRGDCLVVFASSFGTNRSQSIILSQLLWTIFNCRGIVCFCFLCPNVTRYLPYLKWLYPFLIVNCVCSNIFSRCSSILFSSSHCGFSNLLRWPRCSPRRMMALESLSCRKFPPTHKR